MCTVCHNNIFTALLRGSDKGFTHTHTQINRLTTAGGIVGGDQPIMAPSHWKITLKELTKYCVDPRY